MRNTLTFDLEEHFHVSAFANNIAQDEWELMESRVERNTCRLLELLSNTGVKSTFFVLGWVAERHSKLIRDVAAAGHEIACHSHLHRKVSSLTPDQFQEDTRRAKQVLEEITGEKVVGYRAPSFSIRSDMPWAFEILASLGFTYDSSVYPVEHPSYGEPNLPLRPFQVLTRAGGLTEVPMTALTWAGRRAPIAGGAYLRLLPFWYTHWAIRTVNRAEDRGVCIYLHPWEIDPDQPRMHGRLTSRLRHYAALRGVERKLTRLLKTCEFVRLDQALAYAERDQYILDLRN